MTDTGASKLTRTCTAVAAVGAVLGLLFNSGTSATGATAPDQAVAVASVSVDAVTPAAG